MRQLVLGALLLVSTAVAPAHADVVEVPVTLRGSPDSMVRQHETARADGYAFARNPAELIELERSGELVRLEGSADYEVAGFVEYTQARPEMRTFIERLAAQYREATGEKLVVTSLSRPASDQPGNAHDLSVHPAGIAVDLRVSQRAESRRWLEATLLSLERRGLLDITREHSPPHYHVALFPKPYLAYVERVSEDRERRAAASGGEAARRSENARDGRGAAGEAVLGAAALVLLLPAAFEALLRRRGGRTPGPQ